MGTWKDSYNKETRRIIDAASGMGKATAGWGVAILFAALLCVIYVLVTGHV